MRRYIKSLEFDINKERIKITDNVESWFIDGTLGEFAPKIQERWLGYLDKVKNDWDKEHQECPDEKG